MGLFKTFSIHKNNSRKYKMKAKTYYGHKFKKKYMKYIEKISENSDIDSIVFSGGAQVCCSCSMG